MKVVSIQLQRKAQAIGCVRLFWLVVVIFFMVKVNSGGQRSSGGPSGKEKAQSRIRAQQEAQRQAERERAEQAAATAKEYANSPDAYTWLSLVNYEATSDSFSQVPWVFLPVSFVKEVGGWDLQKKLERYSTPIDPTSQGRGATIAHHEGASTPGKRIAIPQSLLTYREARKLIVGDIRNHIIDRAAKEDGSQWVTYEIRCTTDQINVFRVWKDDLSKPGLWKQEKSFWIELG